MNYRWISCLLILLLTACVDTFQTKTEVIGERYVVEGGITNLAPPYFVTLTQASNFSPLIDGIVRFVSGATIKICDDLGSCTPLFEVSKGQYQTAINVPPGVPGRKYHVVINLSDGQEFQSEPELLTIAPPITNVYVEWDPSTVLTKGFNVFIDSQDPGDEENYYKWETESFYPYSSRFCFNRIYERNIRNIQSDQLINGNTLSRVMVKNVPFTSTSVYVVQVYQIAISKRAYSYFDLVKKQVSTKGSIFDPPTSFLRGNLINMTNPDDEVLGYFTAGGAYRKDLVIDRSKTGLFPRPFENLVSEPQYCGVPCNQQCVTLSNGKCGNRPCPPDCALLPGKTNIAPLAWPFPHQECE